MKMPREPIGRIARCATLALLLAALAPSAWASKCGNGVCNKDENLGSCPVDCGGAEPPPDDGGNDSGTDLKLSCDFLDEVDDNVLSDGDGPYIDGVEKVGCSTGGTTQPNLSGILLDAGTKGKFRPGDRFLDLAFAECEGTDCYQIADDSNGDGVLDDGLPASIFEVDSDGIGEQFWITVRPYRLGQDHIQELPAGEYVMAVRFNLNQDPNGSRIVINLAARDVRGDQFQGTLCDLGESGTNATLATDALVLTNPDSAIGRFVVTTVDGIGDDDIIVNGEVATEGDHGFMKAAICSNIPPLEGVVCDGADNSGLCNFHGFVNVRFTMAADVLP